MPGINDDKVAPPTWGTFAKLENCMKRPVADYMLYRRRCSLREAMHSASNCSRTKMAHAVTPGRNRVEAAEIFGSPIESVSDEVYLVMRMVRRWPFRNLVRLWKTTTGANGVLAKRWFRLPYATGTTAAAAPSDSRAGQTF
ncbi:hypothetical protein K449DRAFT_437180 [Hypoxylon sp. EC38]|nr:hypothetical protein K449DRAFT_437180 [Hypoxylon sp. EC38]